MTLTIISTMTLKHTWAAPSWGSVATPRGVDLIGQVAGVEGADIKKNLYTFYYNIVFN